MPMRTTPHLVCYYARTIYILDAHTYLCACAQTHCRQSQVICFTAYVYITCSVIVLVKCTEGCTIGSCQSITCCACIATNIETVFGIGITDREESEVANFLTRRTSQRCRFVYGANKQMNEQNLCIIERYTPCIMYSAERCMDTPQYHVIPILYRCLWAQANISIWLILWLLGGDNLLLKKPLIVQCHVHTITTAAWTAGIRIFSTS